VLAAILVVVILLALGLTAALWMQRQQFLAAGREIARRFDAVNGLLIQTRADARQALVLAQSQSEKIAAFENALQETKSQYMALEQAWQAFSNNHHLSDDVLLNDIERLLTMADQQLRVAGSPSNAIIALETAQAQLGRADRPRFASLQQVLKADLERLRAVDTIDVLAQSSRLERLVDLVDAAPLLVPDAAAVSDPRAAPAPAPSNAAPAPAATLPANATVWQRWREQIVSWPARAGKSLLHELGGLVRVQRVDEPSALLLSSEQTQQLRITLRQRLLMVQLALLMRQPVVWQRELDTVVQMLEMYFDRRAGESLAALNLARELAKTPISNPSLPDISDSLSAVTALRTADVNHALQQQD
jgi:uroporphyrin-3 C-methyltransferase